LDTQQPKQFNILLIGDSCLDVYHYGHCSRLSPEAPVPIFKQDETKVVPGMGGNVKKILENFNHNVDSHFNSEEIKKIRLVDSRFNHHLLRMDEEPDKIKPFAFKNKKKFDAIVVSDYNKGFVTKEVATELSQFAKDSKIPMFVDSKKEDLSCYEGCIIKVNSSEWKKLKSRPLDCDFVVTLGKEGALLNNVMYPAMKTEVFDVCGAGDAFLCGLVHSYLKTGDLEASMWFANRCGAIAVGHFGTYAITLEDTDVNIC